MAFIINEGDGGATPPGDDTLIKEGSEATFMTDVIEGSGEVPVIVDFWAPWCGPCKQLGPMLEKLVRDAQGRVRLVKINVDENPAIAQQLRIQSIPTVYAFKDGRPLDGFAGALPESQLKAFIERLVGQEVVSPADEAIGHAQALMEAGDAAGAIAVLKHVLAREPGHPGAAAGLARTHIAAGNLDEARAVLDSLPAEIAATSEVAGARSALELAGQGPKDAGEKAALEARVAENPNDHQARFDLALARHAAGDAEAALDGLLEIVRRDRSWNDDAARKQLLKFFEALGPTHELTVSARRRLSSLLFS